eukprot:CAMPEP_0194345768 /NCGR_PEP_ID=MMETSP0171-20130528/105042_1 /TAXON_ID=218684 /ORGANISM="Corethron pennatum, Strain L29A3" /LENGTH=189 /DNA_ID=CAMNT_0039112793 /DNA_START=668 /DNA_END=1239 /DNA_ORIENTATION=+
MVYPANLEKLTERDILVTEAGVHTKPIEEALKELESKLQLGFENVPSDKRPTIIRMVTFTPHFKTKTGDYDTKELEALKNNKTAPRVVAERNDSNQQVEFRTLPPYDRSVLWLDGTNSLGKAKVGGSVGAYGDCQHFCMPGPTDEIARALGGSRSKQLRRDKMLFLITDRRFFGPGFYFLILSQGCSNK